VGDGDPITIDRPEGGTLTVRLASVDAPEMCHSKHDPQCRRPGQPFGDEARRSLQELALGGPALLNCENRPDKYGRAVCDVKVGAADLSLEQVARRYGWYYAGRHKRLEIQAAELAARLARRGLSSQADPIRPSDWRRFCWTEERCG